MEGTLGHGWKDSTMGKVFLRERYPPKKRMMKVKRLRLSRHRVMMVSGTMVTWKVKVSSSGQVEMCTMESGWLIEDTDKARLLTLKEELDWQANGS